MPDLSASYQRRCEPEDAWTLDDSGSRSSLKAGENDDEVA
jgi:hypothetical protein